MSYYLVFSKLYSAMSPVVVSHHLSELSYGRRCTAVPVSSARVFRFAGPYFPASGTSFRPHGPVSCLFRNSGIASIASIARPCGKEVDRSETVLCQNLSPIRAPVGQGMRRPGILGLRGSCYLSGEVTWDNQLTWINIISTHHLHQNQGIWFLPYEGHVLGI